MTFARTFGAVTREMIIRLANLISQRQLHYIFFPHWDILYLSAVQAAEMGVASGVYIISSSPITNLQCQKGILCRKCFQRIKYRRARHSGIHFA